MDEIAKIRLKSGALIKARHYLLHQTPSDMVAITEITENIVDLTGSRLVADRVAKIPQVPAAEQQLLKQALVALDNSIASEASAREILEHAKGVFDLVPWPPKGLDPRLMDDLEASPGQSDDIARWPP